MRQAQRIILAPAEGEMHALEFTIDDAPLLQSQLGVTSRSSQTIKRIFDIAVALLLLGFLAPICLIVSLMIKRSGGPIFFAHQRVGRGGRVFKCFKFRTMVPDAAEVLEQMLALDPEAREEWLRTRKLKNDPRITRIGKFLRITSIDEVPQLINVVLGDMSLVGPRPVVPQELRQHYKGDASYYLQVRPGLTGLWQISGRNHTDYEKRAQLDSWYVCNWSLWGDIVILFRTIPVVIAGRGAY
jgi:Undecaprenyl-phosphate galactose phosphotransferase WbaP